MQLEHSSILTFLQLLKQVYLVNPAFILFAASVAAPAGNDAEIAVAIAAAMAKSKS